MSLEGIETYLRNRKPGTSLAGTFYVDPQIFEIERKKLFHPAWMLAGHISSIPNVGDYFCFEFDSESFIVIRQESGDVAAFVNICLHRGCRLVQGLPGHVNHFECPYHNWLYSIDGRLLYARNMPGSFTAKSVRLIESQVRIVGGLIFLCATEKPSFDFDLETGDIHGLLAPLRLECTRVAAGHHWIVEANWKLLIENFDECYHCHSLHPQYCNIMAHARAEALGSPELQHEYAGRVAEWRAKATSLGRSVQALSPESHRTVWFGRFPLKAGCKTQSRDGRLVAPLLGGVSESDEGMTSVRLYPLTYIIAPADYVVLVRFFPLGAERTQVNLTWLVDSTAEEGVDYDRTELMYLWKTTTEQDNAIVALNHAGVRSRFWSGGSYSNTERFCEIFLQWYTLGMEAP